MRLIRSKYASSRDVFKAVARPNLKQGSSQASLDHSKSRQRSERKGWKEGVSECATLEEGEGWRRGADKERFVGFPTAPLLFSLSPPLPNHSLRRQRRHVQPQSLPVKMDSVFQLGGAAMESQSVQTVQTRLMQSALYFTHWS
ncbi:hypothetical protein PAMP_024338 [Pampus punctatissimus]